MKAACAWTTLLLLALAGACGDDQGGAASVVDASTTRVCAPQNMSSWMPTWRPPKLPTAACTNAQLAAVFVACESSTSTTAECSAWNRDPANAGCLQCLYSTEDEPTYGPVIDLKNGVRVANLPGCIALLEGDRSPAGCGAELQAYFSCGEAACEANCEKLDEFQKCETDAGRTVCANYGPGKVCGDPSMYPRCVDPDSYTDFFLAYSRMFCGEPAADAGSSSPDGGASRDAGTVGATLSPAHAPTNRSAAMPSWAAALQATSRR